MELEGSKWFGEPRYKLGSKVFFFFFKFFLKILFIGSFFFTCWSWDCEKMEGILWIEDIVECTILILIFSTSSVDVVRFVNPLKVVAQRNTFRTLVNAQNESVLVMKIKSFNHIG